MVRPERPADTTRAVSPVVGIILLVVIGVLLAGIAGILAIGISEQTPEESPQFLVETSHSTAGLVIIPKVIDHRVKVVINGVTVTTIDVTDKHNQLLLPVAFDDRVDFVADVGRQQLLLQERIREQEAGDFIVYYTFSEGEGTTLIDRSTNENDGTLNGDPTWVKDSEGTALEFDGSGDYVRVDDLNAKKSADVSEFTVAVKYRISGDTGDVQQFVEHRNQTTGFEWFLETASGNVPYEVEYSVWPTGQQQTGVTTGSLNADDVHVAVGTYDGSTMDLYLDGTYIGSHDIGGTVEMGMLVIGADAIQGDSQYLDGRIYQLRLYYAAFDDDEVDMLTQVMEAEAE